ncbi:phosphoglycolate phosphatase [Tranquillimonas alkanivorans]|uniref:Phosphoglycolate phosphatase n=1 Tax=Tranquillimonas alkanivorans TaxID=441119 RepID=A0A1I5SA74_9RHOB|nr:phosphoglycolate phosphatase [Tranquillimonas alkanivorans]SFP67613.1 phosphoglycolate phosphatase [Tranquillimonas alkanivorans]
MTGIVFDLDGTLIDSAPDIRAAANAVLAAEGRAPLTLAQATHFIGNGASVFVTRMAEAADLPDDPDTHARLLTGFLERYETAVDLTRPYPGVPEALDALAASGHTLGLCTNKPAGPTRAVLAHLGLSGWFKVIVGGDSLPVRKPDPAPLLAAAERLGGAALYVGDSEIDAETAQHAGIPFALFTEGYRKRPAEQIPHDRRFARFGDLPRLAGDLLGSTVS